MIALLASAAAACSNDVTRLPAFTGSTGGASRTAANTDQPMPPSTVNAGATAATAAPAGSVARYDLPPPAATSYAPPSPPAASYAPPPSPTKVAAAPAAPARTSTVTVRDGDTVYSLARQYDIRPSAIIEANGLPANGSIRVGQRLTVPGGNDIRVADASAKAGVHSDAAIPPTRGAPPKNLGTITVKPDDAARHGAAPAPAPAPVKIAKADPKVEAGKSDKAPMAVPPAVATPAAPPPAAAVPPPAAEKTIAAVDPVADEPSADGQQFRWPVRGRIISGFGAKPNGERNDGINIAVPEGTSVKAAEAGTVIYAGNEIAGYGNLLLIRHAGGWVSAYAYNKDLTVKRGDAVKRGQIVARAGNSGSASSPQVHFELRKGSNPVNPLDHLAGS